MTTRSRTRQLWTEGKKSERQYWKGVFEGQAIDVDEENRRAVPAEIINAYGHHPDTEETLRMLDVGSGPISKLGRYWDGRAVELTCVDPLADFYNELLDEFCPELQVRPVYGTGEELLERFAEQSFDVVYSLNALDHAYDPMTAVKNMAALTRSSGLVYFVVVENEAEFWKYEGMHQWNFFIENGALKLRDRAPDPVDCSTELGRERYELECRNVPQTVFEGDPWEQIRNFIHVTIRRKRRR